MPIRSNTGNPDIHRTAMLGPPGSAVDTETSDRECCADPRVRLLYAVLYAAGLALGAIGSLGALIWAPLLWCAAAGLVVITVSFAVSAGRF